MGGEAQDQPDVAPGHEGDQLRVRPPWVSLRHRPVLLVALAVACLPFAVTALRAGTHHFVPTGDNAIVALRAGDVFGPNSPSLGMPSTLSLYTGGAASNHPGPMLFWVLAAPYALTGHSTVGFLLGVVALQVGATIAVALVANRRGGPALTLPALLAVSVLGWALDGPSLTEALNPFLVILPFLAFLFLSWDLALGEERSLVFTGVTASLVVQSHTSYGLVVAAVSVAAITGLVLSVRRRWRNFQPERRAALKLALRRALVGTVGALAVCWAPPLVQQVRSDHPNLSALFKGLSPGSRPRHPSADFARTALQSTLGIRPLWAQQHQGVAVNAHAPSAWSALVVLVALVGLGVWAWSHRHRPVAWLLTLAGVALITAYLSARAAPNQFDPQSFRYLWAIGPFAWVAVVWAAVEVIRLTRRSSPVGAVFRRAITRPARRVAAAASLTFLVVATTAACVATDPTGARAGSEEAASVRAIVAVTPQLIRRVDRRPVYLVAPAGVSAFFTLGPALVRNLDQHGFRVRVPGITEAYGGGRTRLDGIEEVILVVSIDKDTPRYTPTTHSVLIARHRTAFRASGPGAAHARQDLEVRVYLAPVRDLTPPSFLAPR